MKVLCSTGAGVLSVLLSACSLPQPPAVSAVSFPEPESAGAMLLQQHCAHCHGAPTPDTHDASSWPGVVYRMQTRIVTKAYQPMTDEEMEALIAYLQKYAGSVQ